MTKLHYILLIFTLLAFSSSFAQNNILFFDLAGGSGRLVPHHPEMKNLAGSVAFLNARLGIKTMGSREWQRVYKYPEIGVGLSHNYLTKSFLGNPTAVYSFINLPLLPASKLKLFIGTQLGLAWGINPFSEQNQENITLGSKCAAYASLNLNSSFHIVRNIELLISAGGYHYSNGNLTKPNKGINLAGAETGLRYTFQGSEVEFNKEPVVLTEKSSSFMVFGSWGWKREITLGPQYYVGSLSEGYYRTISNKSRLSAGFDLFYDEGVLNFTQKENKLKNVLAAGLFVGHELTFNHFSIVTQAGIYIRNPHPYDPFYYERLGLRYIIAGRIVPSLSLKAHEFKIDFVEWGIGFVLWRS
jgi:hypothetical protein